MAQSDACRRSQSWVRSRDLCTTNTVSSGAFAGTAGLPMVIQNSGNNVLIQNATIVNVQIK